MFYNLLIFILFYFLEHEGTASDSVSIVMVEHPSKSLSGSAKQFLNFTFMAKKSGKKHSSKSKQGTFDENDF